MEKTLKIIFRVVIIGLILFSMILAYHVFFMQNPNPFSGWSELPLVFGVLMLFIGITIGMLFLWALLMSGIFTFLNWVFD